MIIARCVSLTLMHEKYMRARVRRLWRCYFVFVVVGVQQFGFAATKMCGSVSPDAPHTESVILLYEYTQQLRQAECVFKGFAIRHKEDTRRDASAMSAIAKSIYLYVISKGAHNARAINRE